MQTPNDALVRVLLVLIRYTKLNIINSQIQIDGKFVINVSLMKKFFVKRKKGSGDGVNSLSLFHLTGRCFFG